MTFVVLHRAQFDLGSGVLLDIEAVHGHGRLIAVDWHAPSLVAAEEEIDVALVASGGMFPMCWRDSGHLFESYQLREDTDYFVDITMPISLAQAEAQAKNHPSWPFDLRLANVFKRDPIRRWQDASTAGRNATTITGQLNLRSHAGVINLAVDCGGSLVAEVVCRKLEYFDEFKALLDGLAEKAADLLLSFDSPVSLSFNTSEELAENDAALHFLMRHIMANASLPSAIEDIIAQPHGQLVERLELISIEEIEEAEGDLVVEIDTTDLTLGGPLARLFAGYTPAALFERDSFESSDTPENRYAKAFLEHCSFIARRLEARMAARGRRAAEREALSWSRILEQALQHDLWRGVGPLTQIPSNSQALIRKRGYKELFRFDLSLRLSLALDWKPGGELSDGLVGDIRPVNQIYEYWCFFILRETLGNICSEVSGGNFISLSKDGLRVQLVKGQRSECRFEFASTSGKKVSVKLFYNRRFRRSKVPRADWAGSYTASFDPDFSIVATSVEDPAAAHWLHFDAKYRLEREQAAKIFETDDEVDSETASAQSAGDYGAELSRVHKQEDLFKMHTYRDGILGTRGAYILFPGDGAGGRTEEPRPNLFVRHPTMLGGGVGHKIPSVGAFDLAPGSESVQVAAIRELLLAVLEVASAGATYSEEQAYFPAPAG